MAEIISSEGKKYKGRTWLQKLLGVREPIVPEPTGQVNRANNASRAALSGDSLHTQNPDYTRKNNHTQLDSNRR